MTRAWRTESHKKPRKRTQVEGGGLQLVQTNKITRLNEQVTHDVSCCQGSLERWILIHPKGSDEKLTHVPVVNVLALGNPNGLSSGRKNARAQSRLNQVGMLLDSEEAGGQKREGLPVWYNAEECPQKRYCPGQCVALRRLKGNRSKTQRKRKGKNKIDHKHTPKKGNPSLVDPRLRPRSGIETLRRSPRGQRRGKKRPNPKGERKTKARQRNTNERLNTDVYWRPRHRSPARPVRER